MGRIDVCTNKMLKVPFSVFVSVCTQFVTVCTSLLLRCGV